jgi:hypothetical protein
MAGSNGRADILVGRRSIETPPMKRPLLVLAVLLACSASGLWAEDVRRAEIFGGFSILSVDGVQGTGWQASLQTNLNKNFGIVADVGGHYKFHVSSYQYLFGPQFSRRGSRTTAFVHGFIGGVRLQGFRNSTNEFAIGLGGGLDVNATDRVAIRVFQADWIPNRFENTWQKTTARVAFGLVFKLGKWGRSPI